MNIIDPIKNLGISTVCKHRPYLSAGQNKQKPKQIFAYMHDNKHLMQLRAATLKLMLWFRVLWKEEDEWVYLKAQ